MASQDRPSITSAGALVPTWEVGGEKKEGEENHS